MMLSKARLLKIAAVTSIVLVCPQSQPSASNPPAPGLWKGKSSPPVNHTKGKEQPAASNQAITKTASAIVKDLYTPNAKAYPAQTEGKTKDKSPSDWWLIGFTGGLVVVGITQAFLFIWQLRMIRRSLNDTKTSADAAIIAANAALASLDRPWLVIEKFKLNELDWLESKNMLVACFQVHNYGKAPAIIKALRVTHFRGPHHHNGRPPWPLPNDVYDMPDKDNVGLFISTHARTRLREVAKPDSQPLYQHVDNTEFVVAGGSSSKRLCFLGYGRLEPSKYMQPLGVTESFLMGTIFYEVPGQPSEVMNFCYKSNIRSGFDIFQDYAPYNERKKTNLNE